MIRQVGPIVLEAAGQVAQDVIRSYLERRIGRHGIDDQQPHPEIARCIAMAHLYLVGAKKHRDRERLYRQLARTELEDAVEIGHRTRLISYSSKAGLMREIDLTIARLSRPESDTEVIAFDLLDLAGKVLDEVE